MATHNRESVRAFLATHPASYPREIRAALPQLSEGALRQCLHRMKKHGLLMVINRRYSLPGTARNLAKETDLRNNGTASPSDHRLVLLKEIRRLRRRFGKKAFDEAAQAIKSIVP